MLQTLKITYGNANYQISATRFYVGSHYKFENLINNITQYDLNIVNVFCPFRFIALSFYT